MVTSPLLRAVGLDPAALALLDRLALRARRPVLGAPGQRRARRAGGAVEFSDFRSYVAGDDIRRVDWNAYARLDRLIVRLYAGDEDLTLTIWIDTSASMGFGDPAKLDAARRLSAALAYVALRGGDRVQTASFADAVDWRTQRLRGRSGVEQLWQALPARRCDGHTDFAALARDAVRGAPGIGVVVSDFLSDSGLELALAALRAARQEPVLLRVLAPEELRPQLSGDLELVDVETGARVDVTVTPAVVREYRRSLEERSAALRRVARRFEALLIDVESGTPLHDALAACRAAGLLA